MGNDSATSPRLSFSTARLGIGTVAFGVDYGIANTSGKVGAAQMNAILEDGARLGFSCIDTARLYGDAEDALGNLAVTQSFPKLVTKFPPLDGHLERLSGHIQSSLNALRVPRLYGLLAHRAVDLIGEQGLRTREALEKLRDNGIIEKFGVSAYSPEEIEKVFETGDVKLVQIPFSVLDQRFLTSGWLEEFSKRGVEVHVRSIFLQGLVFLNPDNLPKFFEPLRNHLKSLRDAILLNNHTIEQVCLHFALMQPEIDVVVMGFTESHQLQSAADRLDMPCDLPWQAFQLTDQKFINPSMWQTGV